MSEQESVHQDMYQHLLSIGTMIPDPPARSMAQEALFNEYLQHIVTPTPQPVSATRPSPVYDVNNGTQRRNGESSGAPNSSVSRPSLLALDDMLSPATYQANDRDNTQRSDESSAVPSFDSRQSLLALEDMLLSSGRHQVILPMLSMQVPIVDIAGTIIEDNGPPTPAMDSIFSDRDDGPRVRLPSMVRELNNVLQTFDRQLGQTVNQIVDGGDFISSNYSFGSSFSSSSSAAEENKMVAVIFDPEKYHDEDQKQCGVCFVEFQPKEIVAELSCCRNKLLHLHCAQGTRDSDRQNKRCPYCRKPNLTF